MKMILVIGGAFQGQAEFAQRELNIREEQIFSDFHKHMRCWIEEGDNLEEKIEELFNQDYKVITSDEVGMGIVPVKLVDRTWREQTGRALCKVAERCESVYRIQCGIAMKIK